MFWAKNGGKDKKGFGARWVEKQKRKGGKEERKEKPERKEPPKLPKQIIRIVNCPNVVVNKV